MEPARGSRWGHPEFSRDFNFEATAFAGDNSGRDAVDGFAAIASALDHGLDDRADDETRPVRGQEGHDLGDLVCLGSAADRRFAAVIGEEALSVLHFVSPDSRHHIARADGVDANAVFDGFERQRPRQSPVRPWTRCRPRSVGRRNVDDRAAFVGDHRLHGLAQMHSLTRLRRLADGNSGTS